MNFLTPLRREEQLHCRRVSAISKLLADAAEDYRAAGFEARAVQGEVFMNLQRQLAGWGENQGANGAVRAVNSFLQALEDGKRKGGGFAGARLRATN